MIKMTTIAKITSRMSTLMFAVRFKTSIPYFTDNVFAWKAAVPSRRKSIRITGTAMIITNEIVIRVFSLSVTILLPFIDYNPGIKNTFCPFDTHNKFFLQAGNLLDFRRLQQVFPASRKSLDFRRLHYNYNMICTSKAPLSLSL